MSPICSRRFSVARLLVCFVLFLMVPGALLAQAVTGAEVTALRSLLEKERVEQKIPGISIAVVVDDQLVYSDGFGFADLESGTHATGSTVYRIGSVSKPIVGTALMQLWEQGRVDLDRDIRAYIPEWPQKNGIITTRHLMTHTSGIRHYNGDEFLSAVAFTDLVEPMKIFKDDPLEFEPGSQYSYSTYGFNLVANIVENVSGMPIADYMKKFVYEPAWMNDTGLEDWTPVQRGRARWYQSNDNGTWQNAPYVDLSNKYAGGGLTSTVEDLARLHIAYARGKLLKPETIETMYTRQKFNDGSVGRYGLAWRLDQVEPRPGETLRQVSHSGGSVGAATLFIRYPDIGFAIAVIANHRANLRTIVQQAVALLFDSPEQR